MVLAISPCIGVGTIGASASLLVVRIGTLCVVADVALDTTTVVVVVYYFNDEHDEEQRTATARVPAQPQCSRTVEERVGVS